MWSFILSFLRHCLSIPNREVQLFVFSDAWDATFVHIVNTGSLPITILRVVAESKTKEEILEEWRNLILTTGEKKEIFLDLRDEIFYKLYRLYVVSAENKKFYLSKKGILQIKQKIK